jgi:hypothetical protein
MNLELKSAQRRLVEGLGVVGIAMAVAASIYAADNKAAPPAGKAPAGKAAPAKATNAPVVIPKSVFVSDIKTGKDPFFPETERGKPPKPKPTPTQANAATNAAPVKPKFIKPPVWDFISYKGNIGGIVLISTTVKTYDFLPGEELTVRVPDPVDETTTVEKKVRMKLVEIRGDSVVISIEGESETKELKLKRVL